MNNFYFNQDSIDSGAVLRGDESRPLPLWLTEQKAREALAQEKVEIVKEDNSLLISMGITLAGILLLLLIFTLWILNKHKN